MRTPKRSRSVSIRTGLRLAISWVMPAVVADGTQPAGTVSVSVPAPRSEEHTSELQSLMRISYAVFCLKKKKKKKQTHTHRRISDTHTSRIRSVEREQCKTTI